MIAFDTKTTLVKHDLPMQAGGVIMYRGGKSPIAPKIINCFPPHVRYIEPFAGACNIILRKPRAPFEVINDLDRQVTTFFQVLRDNPSELLLQLMLTPYSREEFATALQEADNLSPLEEARAFFIRHNQGFAGKADSVGDWGIGNEIWDGHQSITSKWNTKIALLQGCAQRLQGIIIDNESALACINRFVAEDTSSETLIYCDPPYLPETRKSSRDYRHEMNADDHEKLLRYLIRLDAMVVLSGYPSEMYNDYLTDWECITFDVSAHSAGRVGKRKGKEAPRRTECLWRNPAASDAAGRQMSMFGVTA